MQATGLCTLKSLGDEDAFYRGGLGRFFFFFFFLGGGGKKMSFWCVFDGHLMGF